MDTANAEFPPFPEFTVNSGAVHTAFFFSNPGSVYRATKSGTWGDARGSTPEIGERFLEAGVRSTIAVLDNIERTFAAMPDDKPDPVTRTHGGTENTEFGSQTPNLTFRVSVSVLRV